MVVIAATTATVKIVERFVNISRNQTNCKNCGKVCQHLQESNHVRIVERFVNILRNQTNCLRLGMVKWKECKWIDYRDEQGKQIFDVPSSKGDRLQSFFKIFD